MTGPEHFAAADRELERIESNTGEDEAMQDAAYRTELIARAQVHAILALAAATARCMPHSGAATATDTEYRSWNEVLDP